MHAKQLFVRKLSGCGDQAFRLPAATTTQIISSIHPSYSVYVSMHGLDVKLNAAVPATLLHTSPLGPSLRTHAWLGVEPFPIHPFERVDELVTSMRAPLPNVSLLHGSPSL